MLIGLEETAQILGIEVEHARRMYVESQWRPELFPAPTLTAGDGPQWDSYEIEEYARRRSDVF